MDAPLEPCPARPRGAPPRLLAGLAALVLAAAAYATYGSSHPTDPLAAGFNAQSNVAFGVQSGRIYTAVVPISTSSAERATMVSARGVSDLGARLIGVRGLARSDAIAILPGGARAVAAEVASVSALRPVAGLRFAPGDPTLGTHIWLAVTFRLHGTGCIGLPVLRLRYTLGGTGFTRDVAVPMRVRTAGSHATCG